MIETMDESTDKTTGAGSGGGDRAFAGECAAAICWAMGILCACLASGFKHLGEPRRGDEGSYYSFPYGVQWHLRDISTGLVHLLLWSSAGWILLGGVLVGVSAAKPESRKIAMTLLLISAFVVAVGSLVTVSSG